LGTYLGKTAPENPPVSLNSLFPEDSVSTDSDEDLAEELDEFFRFMIWNDLSGEEEEEDSSFIEDEEREGSVSATDLFAEIDDFDDIMGTMNQRLLSLATRCMCVQGLWRLSRGLVLFRASNEQDSP